MGNWLLIAVGIIFLISVIWGVSQGLLRISVSLAATIVTVIVVVMLTPKVSQAVQERTTIDDSIARVITAMITPDEEEVPESQEETAQAEMDQDRTDAADDVGQTDLSQQEQIQAVEGSTFPGFLQDSILENNNSENYQKLGVETFYDYVGAYVAGLIIKILAFLFVYAVLRVFIRILMNMIDLISELPVLHGINRVAGGLVGVCVGLIAVWIFFLIVTLVCTTSFGQECFQQIDNNQILTVLYKNNYILRFLSSVK